MCYILHNLQRFLSNDSAYLQHTHTHTHTHADTPVGCRVHFYFLIIFGFLWPLYCAFFSYASSFYQQYFFNYYKNKRYKINTVYVIILRSITGHQDTLSRSAKASTHTVVGCREHFIFYNYRFYLVFILCMLFLCFIFLPAVSLQLLQEGMMWNKYSVWVMILRNITVCMYGTTTIKALDCAEEWATWNQDPGQAYVLTLFCNFILLFQFALFYILPFPLCFYCLSKVRE